MANTEFQRRILRAADPFTFDQSPLESQTKYKNQHLLRSWLDRSIQHEASVKPYSQRAYLVASDLSLLQSSYANAKSLDSEVARRPPERSDEELRKLYQKHWAVEIGGRYYELVQKDGWSEFSCTAAARRDLRRVVTKIFIGRTHMAPQVLEKIGQAIISTQTSYEVTRDNCHRFVRVFSSICLCPCHDLEPLDFLPFGIEEHLATSKLDANTGLRWGSNTSGTAKASDLVGGEGSFWEKRYRQPGFELRRMVRSVTKKQDQDEDGKSTNTRYIIHQEETSYFWEIDPIATNALYYCTPIAHVPFLNIIRFDKTTEYKVRREGFWREEYVKDLKKVTTMVDGPHGVLWPDGDEEILRPRKFMGNGRGELRDHNGLRLRSRSEVRKPPDDFLGYLGFQIEKFFSSRTPFYYERPLWDLGWIASQGLTNRFLRP